MIKIYYNKILKILTSFFIKKTKKNESFVFMVFVNFLAFKFFLFISSLTIKILILSDLQACWIARLLISEPVTESLILEPSIAPVPTLNLNFFEEVQIHEPLHLNLNETFDSQVLFINYARAMINNDDYFVNQVFTKGSELAHVLKTHLKTAITVVNITRVFYSENTEKNLNKVLAFYDNCYFQLLSL